MTRSSTLITLLYFLFLAVSLQAIGQDDFHMDRINKFYSKYSPLEYLKNLGDDFKEMRAPHVFLVPPSPSNWVKAEHIPDLLKLIYSTDSTRSVVSFVSSHLTAEKFSSIGREAQNLIESFKTRKSYPLVLNSYGQPNKKNGKELAHWWKNYSLMQGAWWRDKDDPSAVFLIAEDSLYYTEELSSPYLVKIKGEMFSMTRSVLESAYILKTLSNDSLVLFDERLERKVSFFKKRWLRLAVVDTARKKGR